MKIKIGFFTIFMFFAMIATHSLYALGGLLAAFLHEIGHILMGKLLHVRFCSLTLSPLGAALKPQDGMGSYGSEMLIATAGPAVNLLSSAVLLAIGNLSSPFLIFFMMSSIALAFLNLLPIRGFDGGRIFVCLLSLTPCRNVAEPLLSFLSFVSLFTLWSFSVYLLLRVCASLSLFVFSCTLFMRIFVFSEKQQP